jgi:NAD(P)H-dependent flavin oxidoreductase YrpB (nitropropane dioxygenase family)
LVDGREDDTVITPAYTGKTLRAVRNAYTQHFEEHPDELQPFPDQIGRSLGDGRDVPADTPGDVAARRSSPTSRPAVAPSTSSPRARIRPPSRQLSERSAGSSPPPDRKRP